MMSSAAASSTISGWVKAICATTSPRCSSARAAAIEALESRSAPATAMRVACSAGESPKSTPTVSATPKVKSITGQLIPISSGNCGMRRMTVRITIHTIASAAAAAAPARRALSVSSWRTSRVRAAPSESRMAISCRRAVASPVRRALTLVQVTRSTISPSTPTITDISHTSRSNMGSPLDERSGTTSVERSSSRIFSPDSRSRALSTSAAAIRLATTRAAAVASPWPTPGRSRPAALRPPRSSGVTMRRAESGIHSVSREMGPIPMNRSGATPTTVTGTPLMVTVEPIAPGLFPKSCSHAVYPMTATAASPAGSADPAAGFTPSTEK
jgi:hypothetical protein